MLWRGIGAFAAVVVLGALAGRVATADDQPAATHDVRVGAATLTVTRGWHTLDPATLSDGRGRMHVVLAQAASPSPSKPTTLGGYRAWSSGPVTMLPTTRGVLTVTCAAAPCGRAIRAVSIAGAAILQPAPDVALRLRAPAVLATLDAARISARAALNAAPPAGPVSRTQAARLAAAHRAALDALRPLASAAADRAASAPADAAAAADRAAFAPADTAAVTDRGASATADAAAAADRGASAPADAAAAADRGASAPADAAAAADRGASVPAGGDGSLGAGLLAVLSRGAFAYDRLADATSGADFLAARAEVVAADQAVDVAVAGLARSGAPVVQRPPVLATAPPTGGASLLTLLLVLATALLVTALAPTCLRRARATRHAPTGAPAPPAAKPCVLAPLRRQPIAPPPTYGRWNEAPRGPGAAPEDGAREPAMASSSTA